VDTAKPIASRAVTMNAEAVVLLVALLTNKSIPRLSRGTNSIEILYPVGFSAKIWFGVPSNLRAATVSSVPICRNACP
jgi:hypothetical protein